MNVIEINGGTRSQRKYVESMVQFCISILMPRISTLDIEVKLTAPQGAMGYCLETDNNRTFEIELDRKLTLRKLMETLAHEMVHQWQWDVYRPTKNPNYNKYTHESLAHGPSSVSYTHLTLPTICSV